jgi:hypothetical protein
LVLEVASSFLVEARDLSLRRYGLRTSVARHGYHMGVGFACSECRFPYLDPEVLL